MRCHARHSRSASSRGRNTSLVKLRAQAVTPKLAACLQKNKARLRIAVDVDEVLGCFLDALCQYTAADHDISYKVSDFWVYNFAKVWNCDQERSSYLVHEFFESPYFTAGIPVMPGAYESLQRLKDTHDLVVVTSRQHCIENITLEWIESNFPDTFSDVYFGNHWAKEGGSRLKSEICRDIGADILIDDNPVYAHDCATNGMQVLLYNWKRQYKWSEQPAHLEHENITVVEKWADVEAHLNRSSPMAVA